MCIIIDITAFLLLLSPHYHQIRNPQTLHKYHGFVQHTKVPSKCFIYALFLIKDIIQTLFKQQFGSQISYFGHLLPVLTEDPSNPKY